MCPLSTSKVSNNVVPRNQKLITFFRFLFKPFGLWFGLRNSKPKQVPPNLVLEREFSQSKKWDHHKVVGLSKQLDMSQEKIEEWLSLKQAQIHASVLDKFCDSAWNFFYYVTETTLGFLVLWDKPWLWDTDECWWVLCKIPTIHC